MERSEIEMIQVGSSNVDSVGYDSELQLLYIRFLNGSEYMYRDVSQYEFDGLINAPSVGSYLHRNIKNSYPYERIA